MHPQTIQVVLSSLHLIEIHKVLLLLKSVDGVEICQHHTDGALRRALLNLSMLLPINSVELLAQQ